MMPFSAMSDNAARLQELSVDYWPMMIAVDRARPDRPVYRLPVAVVRATFLV